MRKQGGNFIENAQVTIKEVRTCIETGIFGIEKQIECGQEYTVYLLNGQTRVYDFYRFDYSPMKWTFEIKSTDMFSAGNISLKFYSTWVKGMPIESGHPSLKK